MTISDRGSAGEQSRPYTQEKVEEIRKEEEGGGKKKGEEGEGKTGERGKRKRLWKETGKEDRRILG
jgi:hypothetical protein